ncbi:peptidylprolyl isomerase [Lysinibacillus sphaericus]|uniref:peptidylprolyl isomerase n=1 Tax=Lysinibacillus sphaericus TaxID=1421 RepID=UPI003CFCB389
MSRRYKVFCFVFSLMAVAFVLTGCGTSAEEEKTAKESGEKTDYSSAVKENPIVTITMSNDEKILIELEPSTAPNTVANFISLVEEGYYDGLIFHRVIPGFMIQGGDPSGNGSGGPEYSIEGEFSSNGFENNLKHERGVISMARTDDPNSAGSQFFIMVEEALNLDGDYASFGKVIGGMETVDAIVAADRDSANKPLEDQQMKKVEVDTKGFDYPAPKVQK